MFKPKEISRAIESAMLSDRYRLRRRWEKLSAVDGGQNNSKDKNKKEENLEAFQAELKRSVDRKKKRELNLAIDYPTTLPISEKVEEIKALIQKEQVLVLGGETGSGKSTQLPKICLELGLGQAGMIAHTQPRRIAARTVSQRVSEELKENSALENYSSLVACKVRFSDTVKPQTQIKLMTDGMLLAEIESDPFLNQYQCIIVDEVHERSLNIDFLLAYLKRLLKKRKDLKLIFTSATIDLDKISRHFDDAPIIEVTGRSFPVETHYFSSDEEDVNEAGGEGSVVNAVDYLLIEESEKVASLAKDILVFFPTEQEIRKYSRQLRQKFDQKFDILPLYGRMPLEQQKKIFSGGSSKRRIILATNVAETSVTVPNIGFVIDTGLARINRYSARSKVQQLPIEKISQASANQRAGRCGRIAPGVCIRLYSEDDFENRSEFTQAEIQRTHLGAVILKLKSLGLGDIEDFPLLDRPDARLVKDAIKQLAELKAITENGKLTATGKKMAALSLDPRFSAALIEAGKRGCLKEALIITTGLSINDPRQRPQEFQAKADKAHEIFQHKGSDFYSFIKLWGFSEHERQRLSANKFRKYCKQAFLSWNSLKEWRDLHFQLSLQCKRLGMPVGEFSLPDKGELSEYLNEVLEDKVLFEQLHKSLMLACFSNIAHMEEPGQYQSVGNRQVFIFPASSLQKQKYPWVMAAQFIETSRLFAHCVAQVEAEWVIEQAGHILKERYFEAFWSKRKGSVQVYRQRSLQALIVEERKAIKVNKENLRFVKDDVRRVFIEGALIRRAYYRPSKAMIDNWKYLDHLLELEQKTRNASVSPDEFQLLNFYEKSIPENIFDTRSFEAWLKGQKKDALSLEQRGLLVHAQENDKKVLAQFPSTLKMGELVLPCEYNFDPSSDSDGLSLTLSYDQLNQVSEERLDWLVLGLLQEKCEALLKSLPKSLRKQCLPLSETAKRCCTQMSFAEGNMLEALCQALLRTKGIQISKNDFQLEKLDNYLKLHLNIVDETGSEIAKGNHLQNLREKIKLIFEDEGVENTGRLQGEAQEQASPKNRFAEDNTQHKNWDFGDIEKEVFVEKKNAQGKLYRVKLFSSLVDETDHVCLRYFDSQEQAAFYHRKGQRRLMQLALSSLKRDLSKRYKKINETTLRLFFAGSGKALVDDLFEALVEEVFFSRSLKENQLVSPSLFYTQADFEHCLKQYRSEVYPLGIELAEMLEAVSEQVFVLRNALSQPASALRQKHHKMIETHLQCLIPVYLKAMSTRLERLQGNIDRDQTQQNQMDKLRTRYKALESKETSFSAKQMHIYSELKWLIEENALGLFAQHLKPVKQLNDKKLNEAFKLLET
jgi:ATP-dependent helicase HrpA